jgi:chromosome segregation ATPase
MNICKEACPIYNNICNLNECDLINSKINQLEQEIINLKESIDVREFELRKKEDLINELRTELIFLEVKIEEFEQKNF